MDGNDADTLSDTLPSLTDSDTDSDTLSPEDEAVSSEGNEGASRRGRKNKVGYRIDVSEGQRLLVDWLFNYRRKDMLRSLCGKASFLKELRKVYAEKRVVEEGIPPPKNFKDYIEGREVRECKHAVDTFPSRFVEDSQLWAWFREKIHLPSYVSSHHSYFRKFAGEIKSILLDEDEVYFRLFFYCDDLTMPYIRSIQPRDTPFTIGKKIIPYFNIMNVFEDVLVPFTRASIFASLDSQRVINVAALLRRVRAIRDSIELALSKLEALPQYEAQRKSEERTEQYHMEREFQERKGRNLDLSTLDMERKRNLRYAKHAHNAAYGSWNQAGLSALQFASNTLSDTPPDNFSFP